MRLTGWLAVFALMVVVGSLMPWVDTAAGNLYGFQGGGLWTLSAGAMILGGLILHSLWRHRWILLGHAVLGGAVALALSSWQVVRVLRRCDDFCTPGIGLGLVLVGGLGALLVARRLVVGTMPVSEAGPA